MEEQTYLVNIGERTVIEPRNGSIIPRKVPDTSIKISEETKNFIEQFANVSINGNLDKEYRINKIKFTILPNLKITHE